MSAPAGGIVTKGGIVVPARALTWRFSHAGGPGGQHVNTSDTRAELVCDLGALQGDELLLSAVRERLGERTRVVAAAERSQAANRQLALARLASRLDAASRRPRPRRPSRPSRAAVEARLEDKKRRARLKESRRARPES